MKLLRVGESYGSSRINWNYYSKRDLMAYAFDLDHGSVDVEIEKQEGHMDERIFSGAILDGIISHIIISGHEEDLSEEQKRTIFKGLREILDAEGLTSPNHSILSFMQDDESYVFEDIQELRREE